MLSTSLAQKGTTHLEHSTHHVMTRKAHVHGLWQYICRRGSHVQVKFASTSPTVASRNTFYQHFAALAQFPRCFSGCQTKLRNGTPTSSLTQGNTPAQDIPLHAPRARVLPYSYQSTAKRHLGNHSHVPQYTSSASNTLEVTGKFRKPPAYGIPSAAATDVESPNNAQEYAPRKPLEDNGVVRRDPGKILQLYAQLQRNAAMGQVEKVLELVRILVTEQREKPNLKLYNALVLVNISMSSGSAAAVGALLEEMQIESIQADINLYHDALKVLAVHPDCILRGSILMEMRKRWFTLTESGWHDVVAGYTRESLIEQALENLDAMRNARVRVQGWLYDLIIYTLCDMKEIDEAVEIMQTRVIDGENTVSSGSWFYLFDHACKVLHYHALRFIWRRHVEQQYLNPTSGQCLQVLTAAARHGDVQLATDVLRILSKRGTTFQSQHYELLIEAYITAADVKTALAILCIMNGSGITPTQSATSSVSKYLRQSPERPQEAFDILNEMKADRQVPKEAMNRIIEACVQQGELVQAIEMYSSFRTICPGGPNVATFNTLLVGCRNEHRIDTAMFLVNEMLAMKIRPNALTYDRLILTCLQGEIEYENAVRYYDEMMSMDLAPRQGTMVELIKRLGAARDKRVGRLLGDMRRLKLEESQIRRYLSDVFPDHPDIA